MTNPVAIDITQVTAVKNIIERDIIEAASIVNDSIFDTLKIDVLRGIENKDTIFVYEKAAKIAAAYTPGDELDAKLGAVQERILEVRPVWTRIPDNLENYREKEPFSIEGLNDGGVQAKHTERQLRLAGKEFGEQVKLNLFHGDRSLGKEAKYGLYDGFLKKMADDITAGNISEAKGNYIVGIDMSGTPEDKYDGIVEFYSKLDPRLQGAEEVLFYVSMKTRLAAVQGYLTKYTGLQNVSVNTEGYRFVEMPNVALVGVYILGTGDGIIASVPNNLQYGTDIDTDSPHVNVMQDPRDAKIIIIQIDQACGTRIKAVSSDAFAMTDHKWTAPGEKTEPPTPTPTPTEKVATPSFSPASWGDGESVEVTLACATDGATIHYTTDGSDPTAESTAYSEALTLTATTTIKAIAVKDGMTNSDVASKTYTKG